MKLFEIAIQYHKDLNPKLWDGNKLKPDVREKLLEIAEAFIDFIDVGLKAEDVILTGSSANYNWTDKSDVDVHIIVDFEKVGCEDLAEELFDSKKDGFKERYDITVNGLPVECYVQDVNADLIAKGVYSLTENKWLDEPKYEPPRDIDSDEVSMKTKEFQRKIDAVISSDDGYEKAKALKKRLMAFRQAGLQKEGEFSEENLTFKALRNNGYVEKLLNYMRDSRSEELSLESEESPMNLKDIYENTSEEILVQGIGTYTLDQAKRNIQGKVNDLAQRVNALIANNDPQGWITLDYLLQKNTLQAFTSAVAEAERARMEQAEANKTQSRDYD